VLIEGTEPGERVANNGDVSYAANGYPASYFVRRGVGEVVSFPIEQIVDSKIDAEGQIAVGLLAPTRALTSSGRLVRIDLRTGEVRQLVPVTPIKPQDDQALPLNRLQLSEDGQLALITELVDGVIQLFAVRDTAGSIAATAKRQITREHGGIRDFVLSGDGRVAWAVTNRAQILKIDVNSGGAREMVGPSVLLDPVLLTAVPGQRISLRGVGFGDQSARAEGFPLPESLGGIRVLLNGVPMRLEQVSPTSIEGQLSWRTPIGSATIELDPPVPSVFESWIEIDVEESRPQFLLRFADDLVAGVVAHGDWRGLVTKQDPARPGEIVHLFGTGFGPVDNPPADGEVAPNSAQSRLLRPLVCNHAFVTTRLDPVEVLWAGLAPGTFATYQITVRLSDRLPQATGPDRGTTVRCSTGGPSETDVFIPATFTLGVP
jgi:uncharacterized protein (TIGR03437 family)